jgi:Zn-dependent protease
VGLHWSLLLVAGLLTWSISSGLAAQHDGTSSSALLAVGGVSVVVFFLSVLAHEVGHALVARRFGVVTDSIDLWLLGGVARLRREAPSPKAEFWISVAGPLVSVAAGGLLLAGAFGLRLAGVEGVVPSTLAWLAVVNVVLAVFNLLPAAPLDGGRVLQAILWWRGGDRHRAGAIAARSGQVLGTLVLVYGLWEVVRGGSGLLTMLVGWFVISNSRSEGAVHEARSSMRSLRVGDAVSAGWLRYRPWTPVAGVLDGPKRVRPGDVVVVEGDHGLPLGFVTEQQLAALTPEERGTLDLGNLLVPLGTAIRAQHDEPLLDALERVSPMLPVITVWDGDRYVGIVTGHEVREAQRRVAEPETAAR